VHGLAKASYCSPIFPAEIGINFIADTRWHPYRGAEFFANVDVELSQSGAQGAL